MTEVAWWREPTKGQWMSFLAAWLGWILDAFDYALYPMVAVAIMREFNASFTMTMLALVLTLSTRLVGGLVAGSMADRWGRKLPLMLSLIWFAVCDGAIYFAPSFLFVFVMRALFGFGMGAEWTAGATLAMENWPGRSRGIISGILQGSYAIGYFLAALVTMLVEPRWGWRPLFLIAALPALLVIPIRFWVPESPEWKANRGRKKESTPWRALLNRDMVRRLVWGTALMTAGFIAYYGITASYPAFIEKELRLAPYVVAGFSLQAKSALTMIFFAGMLIGSTACGWLAGKKGVVLAIALPAVLTLAILPVYVGWFGSLALGAALMGVFGIGYCGVTPLLLTSLFPANIRARAVGLVYHAGAFLGALAILAISWLHEGFGWTLAQAIFAVVAVGQVLLMIGIKFAPRENTSVAPAAVAENASVKAAA